ncbi:MAG: hypothetical protein JWN49_677 [Parcubacteria group bacterium]|nr:hypothetical protein [Parcubacteria group bacterium]
MATVHLTQGHHGLYIRHSDTDLRKRIVLTSELLARPILGPNLLPAPGVIQGVIRCALQALLDLPTFDAAVSYVVAQKEGVPHLALPYREWGEITFGSPETVIVGFSHDSREPGLAFQGVLEWLEEKFPNRNLGEEEFTKFARGWVSAARWRNFFEARIHRQIEVDRTKAEALRLAAEKLILRASEVEAVLGQR